MGEKSQPTSEEIRAERIEHDKLRERDLAEKLGISEARLLEAHLGHGVTRIDATPDRVIAAAESLGEVLALTRTPSVVHERTGTYANFRPGEHAAMVLAEEIDLRIFPAHWVHAFAVEKPGKDGPARSLQIFDAAGDAVHKIHLRSTSDQSCWPSLVADLKQEDQSDATGFKPRKPAEAARANAERVDVLRDEWRKLTDSHQFLRLTRKLKMNRLGAYRIAGAPLAEELAPDCVPALLEAVAAQSVPVMIFVGNHGCIQIHSGRIEKIVTMGPWFNVMDPRFNLHLRADHIAEVWAVEKPTQRGPAISVEAFDAEGTLILQVFGYRKPEQDFTGAFKALVDAQPRAATVEAVE
jgi:putative hemin transport protein